MHTEYKQAKQFIMETSNAKRPRVQREQCITNILPVEVLGHLFVTFLGPGHYRYVAGTCCAFAEAYGRVMNDHNGRKTTWESAAASVACARLCLNEADMVVSIALPAAQIGQIDVIDFLYRNDFLLVLGTSTIFKSSYVWPDKSARIWNEIQVLATMERQ
jgi:hypothetical protein